MTYSSSSQDKDDSAVDETNQQQQRNFLEIQDWHVVLGDPQRRADRTTTATELLSTVKADWKGKCKGMRKETWLPLALKDFDSRLHNSFPLTKYPSIDDLGRVLIKCTRQARDRIETPNLYGFPQDKRAGYGIAKADVALKFYLESRDPPVLANELQRHRNNLAKVQHQRVQPPAYMMEGFDKTLTFFEERLDAADRGDTLARNLLENLHPLNALKEQWKHIQAADWTAMSRWKEPSRDRAPVRTLPVSRKCNAEHDMEVDKPRYNHGSGSDSLKEVLLLLDGSMSNMSRMSHESLGGSANKGVLPQQHSGDSKKLLVSHESNSLDSLAEEGITRDVETHSTFHLSFHSTDSDELMQVRSVESKNMERMVPLQEQTREHSLRRRSDKMQPPHSQNRITRSPAGYFWPYSQNLAAESNEFETRSPDPISMKVAPGLEGPASEFED